MAHCLSNQSLNITNQANQINISSSNIFAISLHGLVSSIGIMENVLILWVVGFHVRRSIISVWILNLAASDLLATAFLPFFTLYMARGNTWTLGRTFCRIYSSTFFLNMFVSGFLLAAISMDRCLVVLRPVWAQNYRNIQLVGKICAMIWALAVVCTIPFYIFRDTIHLSNGKILCYYNYNVFLPSEPFDLEALRRQRKEALAFMKLFLAFLIPLVIIILSYIAVYSHLARRGCRRSFRFVRLLIAVVVSFVLCWAPYHLFITMEVMSPCGHPAHTFAAGGLKIAATLGFLNSILNPILYVFSCPDLCTKIRHSLGAVMESVLAEDLAELARRRSCTSTTTTTEHVRKLSSITTLCLKTEEQDESVAEQIALRSGSH